LDIPGVGTVKAASDGNLQATAIAVGSFTACAIRPDRTVACWGLNDQGQLGNGTRDTSPNNNWTPELVPQEVSRLEGAIAVAVGGEYACAIITAGRVKCWGSNQLGELGAGLPTGAGSFSATPVDVVGVTGATRITTGYSSACVIVAGGRVKCWGSGDLGQLGNGSTRDRNAPVTVKGSAVPGKSPLGADSPVQSSQAAA